MTKQVDEIRALPLANILVVDLEATCSDDETIKGSAMEIIEIGACWVSHRGEVLDTFQTFVCPVVNRRLTQFCTELTTITQDQVDAAPTFNLVAPVFQEFALKHLQDDSIWASWGNYDKAQFEYDSARHGVENPTEHLAHVNLKMLFAKQRNIKRVGMMGALGILKIPHLGSHHRALDDAVNIAAILNTMRS